MIIYVWKGDYRSYGFSQDLWGGNVISVEVPNNFSGGNKTYNPETSEWITDPPYEMTHEDYVREANSIKQGLLDEVDTVTKQWLIDLQLDDLSDEDRVKLVAWRAYRKLVVAVDTSLAPDIEWPDKPEV